MNACWELTLCLCTGHLPLKDIEIRVGNSSTDLQRNPLCAWFPGTIGKSQLPARRTHKALHVAAPAAVAALTRGPRAVTHGPYLLSPACSVFCVPTLRNELNETGSSKWGAGGGGGRRNIVAVVADLQGVAAVLLLRSKLEVVKC